jgi:hypothetical protein
MTRKIIDYLKADLRPSIVKDIRDIAHYHARPRKTVEAGFFSVPRHVFCYIDFLGHIAVGKGNTESAVSFIRDYFPSQYHDYAALTYSMWRHGTVHEYKPKVFYAEFSNQSPKKVQIAWLSNNDNKRIERSFHLQFLPMAGKRGKIHLCINICQLVNDLLTALDNLVDKLTSDRNFRRDCQHRLNNVLDPKPYTSISGRHWQQIVYQEIGLAWKNRSNTKIDKLGNTIKSK